MVALCKSSTLAFVSFFAFLFGLEKRGWKLITIIAIITIGMILMVVSEVQFDFIGYPSPSTQCRFQCTKFRFVLVITASAVSGLRWSLTQILLQHTPATSNPVSTLYHLAPVMFASLILSHIAFEQLAALVSHALFTLRLIPLLLLPGSVVFAMNITQFELICQTGVVTLSEGSINGVGGGTCIWK